MSIYKFYCTLYFVIGQEKKHNKYKKYCGLVNKIII